MWGSRPFLAAYWKPAWERNDRLSVACTSQGAGSAGPLAVSVDTILYILTEHVLDHACEDSPASMRHWLLALSTTCKRLAEVLRGPAYVKQWNLLYAVDRPWCFPQVNVDLKPSNSALVPGSKDPPVDLDQEDLVYTIVSVRLSWCARFVKVLYQDRDSESTDAQLLHGFKRVRPDPTGEDRSGESLALFWDVDDLRRCAAEMMGFNVEKNGVPELSTMFSDSGYNYRTGFIRCPRQLNRLRRCWSYLSTGRPGSKPSISEIVLFPWKVRDDRLGFYCGRMSYYWDGRRSHSSFTVFTYNARTGEAHLVFQREYLGQVACERPFLIDYTRNALYVVSGDHCRLECYAPWNVPSDVRIKERMKGVEFNCRAMTVFVEGGFHVDEAQKAMPNGVDFRTARFHPNAMYAGEWLMKWMNDLSPGGHADSRCALSVEQLRTLVADGGLFSTYEILKDSFDACENMYAMDIMLSVRGGLLEERDEYSRVTGLIRMARHVLDVWDRRLDSEDVMPMKVIVSILSLAGGVEAKKKVVAGVERVVNCPFFCKFHIHPPMDMLRNEFLPLVDLRKTFAHEAFKNFPFLTRWVGNFPLKCTDEVHDALVEGMKANVAEFARMGYPINIRGRRDCQTLFGICFNEREMGLCTWMLEEFKYERLEPRIGMDRNDWRWFDFGEEGETIERAMAKFMNDGGREPWIDREHFIASSPRIEMCKDVY